MTVNSLQAREVLDLCIGKPPARPLPLSATVGDALLALRSGGDDRLVIWTADGPAPERKACAGNVCMVDILCYLCAKQNLDAPMAALGAPASALLPPLAATSLVRRVEPSSSILEALDAILDGAQSLVVPIRAVASRRKFTSASAAELCWLTQEDFVRFFLNSIALFSPVPALSVTDLGLVRPAALAVRPQDPALSALPLIRAALAEQTSVAVVSDDGRLIGEISPFTLAHCDERVAPALAALSAGDLMTFIDCAGAPRKSAVRSIKAQLRAKGLLGMLELLDADVSPPFSPSTSSSWSDDESSPSSPPLSNGRGRPRGMRSAWRMGRRSEEAIVCHPWSSLVAVMIQALAHRVSYVWVVDDDDCFLVGIVTFSDILGVFREQLEQ
ncbi:CBS domain-containing protein [Musa troglodytarum]|uniref:CBS domain-containing protein n=1 Tax=Musa troglodytarum TaxID=320322 RepID=A0A9E7JU81_9LILI|nr:CBS domain-containing protein [Musa troglodytarum]